MSNQELAVQHDKMMKAAPELSIEIIKKYICSNATDQEAYFFLQLCKAQGLNPFLREAYLIKYGTSPATLVTGKETFTKRADRQPQYNGFKAGIIVSVNGTMQFREGSMLQATEQLLGGWSEVYRKDREHPYRIEVALSEYIGKKSDGTVNSQWTTRPATMIRKVALVQGLREAFPEEFGGMYSEEEYVYAVPSDQEPGETKPPIQMPKQKEAEKVQEQTACAETVVEPEHQTEPEQSPINEKPEPAGPYISEPQAKRFWAIAKAADRTDEQIHVWLKDLYGINSTSKIPKSMYDVICTNAATKTKQREPGEDG